jgi:hypothetical protein
LRASVVLQRRELPSEGASNTSATTAVGSDAGIAGDERASTRSFIERVRLRYV